MSVNKLIAIGRLTADPQLRHTPSGASVANFTLAVNESWKDKDGQKQERCEFMRIVVWGKLAELCAQYLAKGRRVYLEGRLQTKQYEKDGQTHHSTEIQAQTVQFIDSQAPQQEAEPGMWG